MTLSSSFLSCCITCLLMIFVMYDLVGHSKADSEEPTKGKKYLKSDFEANFVDRRLLGMTEEMKRQVEELLKESEEKIPNFRFNVTRISVSNSRNEFPKKIYIPGTVGVVLMIVGCCRRFCCKSSSKKRNKTTINVIEVQEQPEVPNVIITPVPTYIQAPVAPPSYMQAQAAPPTYIEMKHI